MQEHPLNLLQAMLEVYSPSGSEEDLAHLLATHMEKHGFRVQWDNAGNVIGEAGYGGPRILFCGHMDTVPGKLDVRNEAGFLHGRGAVDAKSTLSAMLVGSIIALKRTTIPIRLTVAGVVEEETSGKGIKALIRENEKYDLAVFGEPSGANNIIIGYKGSLKLQVTVQTHGGHSAAPWSSKNSLEEAFEFWTILKQTILRNDSAEKFPNITGCITSAHAGETDNNVPSRADLKIDIRLPPESKPEKITAQLAQFASQYESSHEGIKLTLETTDSCPAYLGDSNSLAVRVFRWAIKNTIGGQVQLVKKTGTSDMNLFAQAYHIPIIAYGPGNSKLDHTDQEKISIQEYLNSIQVYANAIERYALIHQDSPQSVLIRQ